jgi:hypothetical protein
VLGLVAALVLPSGSSDDDHSGSERITPSDMEALALQGLWVELVEHVSNLPRSPVTDYFAELAAELPRRFEGFEPPVDRGWLTVDLGDEDEGEGESV